MPLSLVPPETVSRQVPLCPTIVDSTSPGQLEHTITGCIAQCGTKATLCGGSWIRGYHTATGRLYSELRFGRQHEQPQAGPFVELVRDRTVYLVVALQGGSGGSLLCVCQPLSGRIVRAIQLPAPAIHLALVSSDGLGILSGGCMALATADRHLLLLDLCLDSDRHLSHEGRPAGVLHLDDCFDKQQGPSLVHGTGVHGCMHICSFDDLVDSDETSMMDENLEVTCLQWLPQLACLGIGLSSGCVHLWDVQAASSRIVVTIATDLPVVALALQEPENDPRCCCYLWVAHGSSISATCAGTFVSTPPSSFSLATLHTLSYQKKVPFQDGRHGYKGLISSRLVFEYQLVPDTVPGMEALGELQSSLHNGETFGSRVLSFRTASSPSTACPVSDAPLSPSGTTRTRSEHVEDLLLLSWQLMRDGRALGTYLSVFDINQWYRAQMPHSFRGNSQQLCPYIGLFSLGEAAANCGSHTILDVRVPPASIKRFGSLDPMVEQTHFPSSLAFSCVFLTAEGLVGTSYMGLQQQLLHDMDMVGPRCLANAGDLCIRFSVAGLISSDHRSPLWHASTATAQKALLDVALDHQLVGFLVNCLCGHMQQPGDPTAEPLLPFVLEWTWKKVKDIKASLNELYGPLFDCSGQDGATTGTRMLAHLEELRILHKLLGHAHGMETASSGLVAVWHDVTGLLSVHLSVLLFLLQSGVLPDHRVGEGSMAYPYTALHTWCQQARSDLGRRLLVDVLVEATLGNVADPRSPLPVEYPPPSIQQATDVYLKQGLEPWAPHTVTYYLLLDISAIILHDYPAVKEKLEYFPSAFDLSAEVESLVQGIWHLDHGNYQEGVESLLQAQLLATAKVRMLLDALWGPAVRLLLQCQPPLALRCLDHLQAAYTPEQMTLHLDVLLANCRVIDALELVRRRSHLSSLEQLLGCIMALARKSKMRQAREQLELLLQVPLSAVEEEQLVSFFCELAEPMWMCHVVLHFLQCGRPHATLPLTGCLQELFREGRAQRAHPPEVRRKVSSTLELVQSFMQVMPLPASQLNAATRRRNQSGAPVQYLGTVPTRVPHKGTTPRLATRVAAVRATMDAAEASKPPAMPSFPDSVAGSELCASMSTPAGDHYTRQSRLEDDAVSLLCTPPITLWEGLPRQMTSGAQPSTSTPASILKRYPLNLPPVTTTPVGLQRGSREDHAATCLTPTEIEDIQPTPDPSVRRLRFALSDSNNSEASPDHDSTGHSLEDSSMLSPPEEQATDEDEASHSKEMEMSSDRSSQFLTPVDSDDSGTDLQDSNPEAVAPPHPAPEQPAASLQPTASLQTTASFQPAATSLPAASLQPRSAGQDLDENQALVQGADETLPEHKVLLPEFLIQEAARCLHLPTAADPAILVPAKPEAKGLPSQPSCASAAPSLAQSGEISDEEDLDGTPLADSYEDTVPESKSWQHQLPDGPALSRGLVAATSEEGSALPGSVDAVDQDDTSQFHIPAEVEEPTALCVDDGTELVDDPPSRACSQASALSLRLPAFAVTGELCTAEAEGTPVIEEQVIIISASEASESEKEEVEEDDIVILSDSCSEALSELHPTRVEISEDSWSSSSSASTRETDAPLAELSNMQPSPSTEPLEVAREPSTGLMTPAGDIEHVQVERSLPNDAVCPLEEGELSPKSGNLHLESMLMTPAKEAHLEEKNIPIAEPFGFVPAVESPFIEASGYDDRRNPTTSKQEPSGITGLSLPVVMVRPLDHSPLPVDDKMIQNESAKPSMLAPSSAQAALKSSGPEAKHDEIDTGKAVKTPKHSAEPPWSQRVVTPSYNLRERRKDTLNEGECGSSTVTPRASRGKSGSVPPSHRSSSSPVKAGHRRESKESPTGKQSPARKTRAASEEPASAHNRTKRRVLQGSSRRMWAVDKKAGTPSPKCETSSSKRKSETPSPRGRSNVKAPLASPQSTGPRRQSKTPSPRRAGVATKQAAMPSSRRRPPTSPVKTPTKAATPSHARGQSTAGRTVQKVSMTHSPQKQSAQTPSPAKEAHMRSSSNDKAPSPPKKTRERRHSSPSTEQERLPVQNPIKDETPMKRKRGRPEGASSSASATRKLAATQHSSHLTPDKQKTPEVEASSLPRQIPRSKQTARTASPTRGSPVPSPAEGKPPSPAKKTARLRQRSSSADDQERLPEPGSSKDDVPSKKAASRTPRRFPAASADKEPPPSSVRRSSRLTPDKQQVPEGHTATPSRLTSTRRMSSSATSSHHALATIAEDDGIGSDEETSSRSRSQPRKRDQITQSKKVPLARRGRLLSGSTALDTIAEAPDTEREELEPTSAAPRNRGSSKRKASEGMEPSGGATKPPEGQPSLRKRVKRQTDAEGFHHLQRAKPVDKGSKPKPPVELFSPPITRHRQLRKAGGESADAMSPSTSKDTSKTKQQRRVVIVPVLSQTPQPSRKAAASSTIFQKTPRQPVIRYKLKLRQPTVPVYRATSSPSTRPPNTKGVKKDE